MRNVEEEERTWGMEAREGRTLTIVLMRSEEDHDGSRGVLPHLCVTLSALFEAVTIV